MSSSDNKVAFESKLVDGEYITIIRTKTPLKVDLVNNDTVAFTAKTGYPLTFTYHKAPMSRL